MRGSEKGVKIIWQKSELITPCFIFGKFNSRDKEGNISATIKVKMTLNGLDFFLVFGSSLYKMAARYVPHV